MSPFIKMGIGALLLGVGFVVSMQAQRELVAKWAEPCEECEDEPAIERPADGAAAWSEEENPTDKAES